MGCITKLARRQHTIITTRQHIRGFKIKGGLLLDIGVHNYLCEHIYILSPSMPLAVDLPRNGFMNQIKGGLDIWGSDSVRANELRQEFKHTRCCRCSH